MKFRQLAFLPVLLLGLRVPSVGEDNLRTEFITLTMRSFQTVAREAMLADDETRIMVYLGTLGKSPLVEYAMFIGADGVIACHTDAHQIGRPVSDEIGKNALTSRDSDSDGLRLTDFKNPQKETVIDASLPVNLGTPKIYSGMVRIGFKNLK